MIDWIENYIAENGFWAFLGQYWWVFAIIIAFIFTFAYYGRGSGGGTGGGPGENIGNGSPCDLTGSSGCN